jgi:hypothetical protein
MSAKKERAQKSMIRSTPSLVLFLRQLHARSARSFDELFACRSRARPRLPHLVPSFVPSVPLVRSRWHVPRRSLAEIRLFDERPDHCTSWRHENAHVRCSHCSWVNRSFVSVACSRLHGNRLRSFAPCAAARGSFDSRQCARHRRTRPAVDAPGAARAPIR